MLKSINPISWLHFPVTGMQPVPAAPALFLVFYSVLECWFVPLKRVGETVLVLLDAEELLLSLRNVTAAQQLHTARFVYSRDQLIALMAPVCQQAHGLTADIRRQTHRRYKTIKCWFWLKHCFTECALRRPSVITQQPYDPAAKQRAAVKVLQWRKAAVHLGVLYARYAEVYCYCQFKKKNIFKPQKVTTTCYSLIATVGLSHKGMKVKLTKVTFSLKSSWSAAGVGAE